MPPKPQILRHLELANPLIMTKDMGYPNPLFVRKGGRVVDGAGLENRNTGNGIGGSNPFPSATDSRFVETFAFGEMAEWLKAHAWKACIG
jgi:hypothetical protein